MEKLDNEKRLYYSKTGYPRRKFYLEESRGIPVQDIWSDISSLSGAHKERLGYPTQKPLALLQRIIKASSNPGDLVLDPFCGCGTSIAAAEIMNRKWIGIDITYSAIAAIQERFKRQKLNIWNDIEVLNIPKTTDEVVKRLLSAKVSSTYARKEFEKFCVTTINGLPNGRMGADGGIDGRIPLVAKNQAIVSVKSGHVGVEHVRALKGLLDEKQIAGVFISRHSPTKPMKDFADTSGLCRIQRNGLFDVSPFPKMQILTLEEILRGKLPEVPYANAA